LFCLGELAIREDFKLAVDKIVQSGGECKQVTAASSGPPIEADDGQQARQHDQQQTNEFSAKLDGAKTKDLKARLLGGLWRRSRKGRSFEHRPTTNRDEAPDGHEETKARTEAEPGDDNGHHDLEAAAADEEDAAAEPNESAGGATHSTRLEPIRLPYYTYHGKTRNIQSPAARMMTIRRRMPSDSYDSTPLDRPTENYQASSAAVAREGGNQVASSSGSTSSIRDDPQQWRDSGAGGRTSTLRRPETSSARQLFGSKASLLGYSNISNLFPDEPTIVWLTGRRRRPAANDEQRQAGKFQQRQHQHLNRSSSLVSLRVQPRHKSQFFATGRRPPARQIVDRLPSTFSMQHDIERLNSRAQRIRAQEEFADHRDGRRLVDASCPVHGRRQTPPPLASDPDWSDSDGRSRAGGARADQDGGERTTSTTTTPTASLHERHKQQAVPTRAASSEIGRGLGQSDQAHGRPDPDYLQQPPLYIYDPAAYYTPASAYYQQQYPPAWAHYGGAPAVPQSGWTRASRLDYRGARGPFEPVRQHFGAYYDGSARFSLYHPSVDGAGIRSSLAPASEQLRRIVGYSPSSVDLAYYEWPPPPPPPPAGSQYGYLQRQVAPVLPFADETGHLPAPPVSLHDGGNFSDPKAATTFNRWQNYYDDDENDHNNGHQDSVRAGPNVVAPDDYFDARPGDATRDKQQEANNLVGKLSRGLRQKWWRPRTSGQ
jgi:hypothetical protein